MGLFSFITTRRRDGRRTSARSANPTLELLRGREAAAAGCLLTAFTVLAGMLAVAGQRMPPYEPNMLVPEAVVARVPFEAIDEAATRTARTDAANREPAVYVPNNTYRQQVRDGVIALGRLGADTTISGFNEVPEAERVKFSLTPEAFTALRGYFSGRTMTQWEEIADQFVEQLATLPVLPSDRAAIERDPAERAFKIVIVHPRLGELERLDHQLLDVVKDREAVRERIAEKAALLPGVAQPLAQSITAMSMQNSQNTMPTVEFDSDLTRFRRQSRYDNEPPVKVTYRANDVMVPAGVRATEFDVKLIARERQAFRDSLGAMGVWLARPAGVGLIAMLGLGMWLYIFAYNPRITRNPLRGLALTGLLIGCLALAVFATGLRPEFAPLTATFPSLLVGIVLAIAYDRRFAMAVGAIHALLVVLCLDRPIGFMLILLAGLATAVIQLHEVRTRGKLVIVGSWCGAAMAAATLFWGFSTQPLQIEGIVRTVATNAGVALLTGFLTGLFVQGVLPAIERYFKVTTSMTLKELNDASHPLLRRLAQEAPGTYQHSLRLADMAEAAADAIGGNGLLCKVAAMYHDIGKINKPQYFVENQAGGPSRHANLSPAMSVLIIVGHVKDGIELAREYAIPSVIRDFIQSHHGTTLVEYFYHAARKKSEFEDAPAPTEFEFRYPGPKPQTREEAIVMLCDGLEGASRTLADPTPARLAQLVHNMAGKRLADGQFDECNLTLAELHKIEQSILKTLSAVYHGRIAYPSDAPIPEEADAPARSAAM